MRLRQRERKNKYHAHYVRVVIFGGARSAHGVLAVQNHSLPFAINTTPVYLGYRLGIDSLGKNSYNKNNIHTLDSSVGRETNG
jgi:hypothetical protein